MRSRLTGISFKNGLWKGFNGRKTSFLLAYGIDYHFGTKDGLIQKLFPEMKAFPNFTIRLFLLEPVNIDMQLERKIKKINYSLELCYLAYSSA